VKKLACVFTLSHNEKYILPIWLNYYHQSFDWEDIYVYDHCSSDESIVYSSDESNDIIEPPGPHTYFQRYGRKHNLKCNVGKVWQSDETGLSEPFWGTQWIEDFERNNIILLLKEYEYVIMAESDELLLPNPEKYKNLRDYIEHLKMNNKDKARATGYEIVHQPDKEPDIDWNSNIKNQRRYWMRYGMWDKTIISSKYLSWSIGFHFVNDNLDPADPDLILCHLHRLDWKWKLERQIERQKEWWNHQGFNKMGTNIMPESMDLSVQENKNQFYKEFISKEFRADPANQGGKAMDKLRRFGAIPVRGDVVKIPEIYDDWRKF